MRNRSETFFVPITVPFTEIYLPKQAGLVLRPVQQILVYQRNNIARDPYFLSACLDATVLPFLTITLRDDQDRELMQDMPVWCLGANDQFAKPTGSIMHARRVLADMRIAPQKSSVRYNNPIVPPVGQNALCLEFVYAQ